MFRLLFALLVGFHLVETVHAQNLKIEESAPLAEPSEGWLKLIQLKNGNTALLHTTKGDGTKVRLYDKARKLIAEKTIRPIYGNKGKINRGSIEGVLNIGDDIVVFSINVIDKTPVLFRIIIDGNTAVLKSEDEVGRLKQISFSDGYAMAFGGVPLPRVVVRKDQYSDNYGVALFNSLVSDRSKRIELIHFGADHQPINRSFYLSPNEEFKYMDLIDFAILGDSKLIASAFIYNTRTGKESYLSLASLDKGNPSIHIKKLESTAGKTFSSGIFRYNKREDLLALVSLADAGSSSYAVYYDPILTLIDPKSLSTSFVKEIELPNVNKTYKEIFGEGESFNGVPQDFYINEDGTYTIVFESIKIVTFQRGSYSTSTTFLGTMAVAILNEKTQELHNYLIPKSHAVTNQPTAGSMGLQDYTPMYISKRQGTAQLLFNSNQYKSFAYVNGKGGNYIFFNDVIENLEKIKNGKLTTIQGISGSDAFICSMMGGNLKKNMLFNSASGKGHSFAMFSVSDYDTETGTFATLKLETDHGKKLKVIWLKL